MGSLPLVPPARWRGEVGHHVPRWSALVHQLPGGNGNTRACGIAGARTGWPRQACQAKMRAIMRRVRDRRRDFHAQTACQIVDGNALVVLEELNTASMTASAAGTVARPGTPDNRKSQAKFACAACG